MKEVHVVKVRTGFVVKSIDHRDRSEQLDVFLDAAGALAAAGEFLSATGSGPRLAIPVVANA